jgi:hypothetical protein
VTPTPTDLSPEGVCLNEILPAPAAVDWDGDGTSDSGDEWIEIYNAGTDAVDISGWFLDNADRDSPPYRIPDETVINPKAFAVFYRRETDVVLADNGDEARLLGPDDMVVDAVAFGQLAPDASYSRDRDGTWYTYWPPSPGAPNLPPGLAPEVMRWWVIRAGRLGR